MPPDPLTSLRPLNFRTQVYSLCTQVKTDQGKTLIQYVQIEPGVNSHLGNGSFWVEIRDAKHVDRSTYK